MVSTGRNETLRSHLSTFLRLSSRTHINRADICSNRSNVYFNRSDIHDNKLKVKLGHSFRFSMPVGSVQPFLNPNLFPEFAKTHQPSTPFPTRHSQTRLAIDLCEYIQQSKARNKSPVAKPRGHTSSFASTAERVTHETAAATRKAWLSSSNEDEEDFSGDKEMQKSTASPHHVIHHMKLTTAQLMTILAFQMFQADLELTSITLPPCQILRIGMRFDLETQGRNGH